MRGAREASAATLIAGLCAASVQGAAARFADQRLVTGYASGAESHLGSTVSMFRGSGQGYAVVGTPRGGDTGDGALHFFHYAPAVGWNAEWRWSLEPSGREQPLPVDLEGPLAFAAPLTAEGTGDIEIFDFYGHYSRVGASWAGDARAVAASSNVLALGFPDALGGNGLIVIYEPDGTGGWTYDDDLVGGPGDRLGSSLAALPNVLVAGAPGHGDNGAVFVYARADPTWVEYQRLDAPVTSQTGAEFGAAVDLEEGTSWIAVGAPFQDRVISPGSAVDVGAVHLFESVGFGWEYASWVRPPGAGAHDHFGWSVALHDELLVAGSPGEDGNAGDAGAAYVFQRTGAEWSAATLRLYDRNGAEHDELGTSVAVGEVGALVGSPNVNGNGVFDQGALLFYRSLVTLFADGFASGDTTAWSSTTP